MLIQILIHVVLGLLVLIGMYFFYQDYKKKKAVERHFEAQRQALFTPLKALDIDEHKLLRPEVNEVTGQAYFFVFDTESFDVIRQEEEESLPSPLVALSWQILDAQHKLIEECSYIIKQEGTLSAEAQNIHLISPKEIAEGEDENSVLELFFQALEPCSVLVAHNVDYHLRSIEYACQRQGMSSEGLKKKKFLCTMQKGLELNFKHSWDGRRLYPALDELFGYLYFSRPKISIRYRKKTLRDIRLVSACLRKLPQELG